MAQPKYVVGLPIPNTEAKVELLQEAGHVFITVNGHRVCFLTVHGQLALNNLTQDAIGHLASVGIDIDGNKIRCFGT